MNTKNEAVDELVNEILEVISGADLEIIFLTHLKVNGVKFPTAKNLMYIFKYLGYDKFIPNGTKIKEEQKWFVFKDISEVLSDKQIWHPLLNTLNK